MSGGSDNIGVSKRGGDHISSDQAGYVGHVTQQVGIDRFSDLAHAGIVDQLTVGGGTSDDNLGAVDLGRLLQSVIVDGTGGFVEVVGHGLKVLRDKGDLFARGLVTVGQMTTVRQVQAHQTVVGVEKSGQGVEVCGGSREGYIVSMFQSNQSGQTHVAR